MNGKGDKDTRTPDHKARRDNYEKIFRPVCLGWQSCNVDYRDACTHNEACKAEAKLREAN